MTDDSPASALIALRTGDAVIDLRSYELRRAGERVHVEPQVFDVIRYLAEHAGRVVPKEELLDTIWGTRFVSESSLTTRIKAARRAGREDAAERVRRAEPIARGKRVAELVVERARLVLLRDAIGVRETSDRLNSLGALEQSSRSIGLADDLPALPTRRMNGDR